MSRSLSLIALVLLCIVASGLYRLSYEVQRMEDELAELNRALGQERETIGVLQAEWSYLSRPEYLQDKAERLMDMKPANARRITRIEDLPWRQERMAPPAVAAASPPAQSQPAVQPQPQQAPLPPVAAAAKAASPAALPVAAQQLPAAQAAEVDTDVAAVLNAMRGAPDRRRAQ